MTKEHSTYFIGMRSENATYFSILNRFASTEGRCSKTVRKVLDVIASDGGCNMMGAFVKSLVV